MVAGRFSGQWYRAIVEEVNLNCEDVIIYFVDYGNRAINLVHDVRPLGPDLATLPAQAVFCKITNYSVSELREMLKNSHTLKMHVDMEDPGGVGRLAGPEFTLIVTL